ncbi:MAG TPA: PfkB family carbohydrate kinase [Streptosporangiaceae bacterium]|nr:PfkB family carbohydrate kinase [Streptosporangiaceae bacterium]
MLHLGNVVVDVVLDVPDWPERGGDVLASATQVTAGGGFNVLAAAVARGMPAGYAGAYGTGPFASLALAALAGSGIEVLQAAKPGLDTGFVVTVVDAAGERTFLTSRGAEAAMTPGDLRGVWAAPDDAVYLSGYGLVHPGNARAILGWLGRLGGPNLVFLDPGPLAGEVPGEVLDRVLRRTDWLTCNAGEAARLTGRGDPAAAATALARRVRGVLVRTGADGCLLAGAAAGPDRGPAAGAGPVHVPAPPVHVPGFAVTAIDTNGAGDTHTGTFIAALARGADVRSAARIANAAAAFSVTRHGPATAPTEAELSRFLTGR